MDRGCPNGHRSREGQQVGRGCDHADLHRRPRCDAVAGEPRCELVLGAVQEQGDRDDARGEGEERPSDGARERGKLCVREDERGREDGYRDQRRGCLVPPRPPGGKPLGRSDDRRASGSQAAGGGRRLDR